MTRNARKRSKPGASASRPQRPRGGSRQAAITVELRSHISPTTASYSPAIFAAPFVATPFVPAPLVSAPLVGTSSAEAPLSATALAAVSFEVAALGRVPLTDALNDALAVSIEQPASSGETGQQSARQPNAVNPEVEASDAMKRSGSASPSPEGPRLSPSEAVQHDQPVDAPSETAMWEGSPAKKRRTDRLCDGSGCLPGESTSPAAPPIPSASATPSEGQGEESEPPLGVSTSAAPLRRTSPKRRRGRRRKTSPSSVPTGLAALSDDCWIDEVGQSWFDALRDELQKPYLLGCLHRMEMERAKKKIFPPDGGTFLAFKLTPLESLRVVIVGQDPYHQEGQATGLAFSVPFGAKVPPSLVNIYKEIVKDGVTKPLHGDLSCWAKQGVFLLNAILTVEQSKPLSHQSWGWREFTDRVIEVVNTRCSNVVFMLWGEPAKKKGANIDREKHLVLEAGHPSPLSARLFLGCDHFNKANEYLVQSGKQPIDWTLPGLPPEGTGTSPLMAFDQFAYNGDKNSSGQTLNIGEMEEAASAQKVTVMQEAAADKKAPGDSKKEGGASEETVRFRQRATAEFGRPQE